jgi:hypothetical protein
MLTNRLNLPESIVQAVLSDPYKSGGDISVTQLIAPAYQRKLRLEHPLVEDVSDRIWSLVGQIGHGILERIPVSDHVLKEERLYMPVSGPRAEWRLSGQFDHLENGVLSDFKFTSVWAAKDGGKIEWEQQLNLLKLLCDHVYAAIYDGRYEVNTLQIVAIFRDWQKSKVGDDGYPDTQVAVLPIQMWEKEQAVAFLHERIAAHQDPDPPVCSDEERWKTPDRYALMKPGGKRAIKLFGNMEEAVAFKEQQPDANTLWIDKRAGEYRRCGAYCAVSHACPAWQKMLSDAPF